MKQRGIVACAITAIIVSLALPGGASDAAEKRPKPKPAAPKVADKNPTPKVKKKLRRVKRLHTAKKIAAEKSHACSQRLQTARRIAKALDQEVLLDFSNAPLSEIVDYLETLREISIVIDDQALEDIGIGPDTPITCSFQAITLRSALALMLDRLDLDYVIRDEVLMITTKEAARSQLDPRIYPIEKRQPGRLVALIPQVIASETWRQAGGTGYITAFNGGLVVAQTDQIHAQIADFIHKLQRAADQLSAAGD